MYNSVLIDISLFGWSFEKNGFNPNLSMQVSRPINNIKLDRTCFVLETLHTKKRDYNFYTCFKMFDNYYLIIINMHILYHDFRIVSGTPVNMR